MGSCQVESRMSIAARAGRRVSTAERCAANESGLGNIELHVRRRPGAESRRIPTEPRARRLQPAYRASSTEMLVGEVWTASSSASDCPDPTGHAARAGKPCGTPGSTRDRSRLAPTDTQPESRIIIRVHRPSFFSQGLERCAVRFALSAGPRAVGRSGSCRPRSAPPHGRSTTFVTGWKVQIHYGIETADRFWLANPLALCAGNCQMTYRTATMSDRRHRSPSTLRPCAHRSRCRRPRFSHVLRSPPSPESRCALESQPRSFLPARDDHHGNGQPPCHARNHGNGPPDERSF